FVSSRRRHTRFSRDWSSDVCSSDLTISEKDPLHDQALTTLANFLEHPFFIPGTEFLLRRGVHVAEGALVPGTAVGHRQDQRMGLARGAKNRLYIVDGKLDSSSHASLRNLNSAQFTALFRAVPLSPSITRMGLAQPSAILLMSSIAAHCY